MLKNRKQMLVSLPIEIVNWIEKKADENYTTKGRLLEKILKEHIENEKK